MRYWKDIKKEDKVVETKSGFEVDGEGLYWYGKENFEAQRSLHKRAIIDRSKK